MKKIIAVTPRLLVEDGALKQFVNDTYVKAILHYDANCIMLTLDNPNIEEVLDLVDGVLVTGGSDIDPKYYGEENKGQSKEVSERLDILDQKVILYCKEKKIPMLGICRGHQSINAFLGGSLKQHIDNHSGIREGHQIIASKNRLLDLGDLFLANSYHHQAVNKLASGLIEVAKNIDGTNEAFIHESLPIIGIQWHPEKNFEWKESKIIFQAFFDLVEEYKNSK